MCKYTHACSLVMWFINNPNVSFMPMISVLVELIARRDASYFAKHMAVYYLIGTPRPRFSVKYIQYSRVPKVRCVLSSDVPLELDKNPSA